LSRAELPAKSSDSGSSPLDSIVIYTDGACSGNPGPGGWAAIVIFPDGIIAKESVVPGFDEVVELGGSEYSTTNNRMEMLAAVRALKFIEDSHVHTDIYTDSVYVIRGITQWAFGWKRKGWKTAEGKDVLNKDLWQSLMHLVGTRKHKVAWHYCRGHQGTPGNERCDELSVLASKGHHLDLYRGPLSGYNFAVMPPPEHQPLPEMKSKVEKPKAFSYLSDVSGVVMRHQDWTSCEQRVKGRSGAKFKKALNLDDEAHILRSWGLDPARTKIKE
jgi:ribonuclease HI